MCCYPVVYLISCLICLEYPDDVLCGNSQLLVRSWCSLILVAILVRVALPFGILHKRYMLFAILFHLVFKGRERYFICFISLSSLVSLVYIRFVLVSRFVS